MYSRFYKSMLIFLSLGILIGWQNPLFGQSLSLKSGSFMEQSVPKGQSQLLQVIDPRGKLQWQESADGTSWQDLPGQNHISLTVQVNSILFLRCCIQEAKCAIVYSDVVKLIPFDLATITTDDISNITITSAIGGGNVMSDENASITARGVCWSTSKNPTTADNKTSDGTGTGHFASNLTGLTANTSYYVRAYATNTAGTAYGNEVTFSTLQNVAPPTVFTSAVSAISQYTASTGGNVASAGGANLTARGACWSTSANPTYSDNKTTDGAGTGWFTSNLTGLAGNTFYYVRAYATNSFGTSYGNEIGFSTSPVPPSVVTSVVSSVTQNSASSGGDVTSDGGASVTIRGVCWSTSPNPTTDDSKTTEGTGTGTFMSNLTGLSGNTFYYVRAYATNSLGTSYGNEISFKTSALLSTVVTSAVSSVSQNTASTGGNVTDDGGATITARGVCWASLQNPTTDGNKTTDGSGTGSFTSNLAGLTANTTYYVRSYATNSAGTSYGNEVIFTTIQNIVQPTVTTASISTITQTSATSGGIITSDGGASVTARGVCWSTSSNPTTVNSKTTDGTGLGSFTSNLAGLTPNTTYYVRSYAANSAGTSYGNEVIFTTIQNIVQPTVTTASVSAITQISAASGGNITSDGGASITARGVCWSTSSNPTTVNSKTTDGTGLGSFTSNLAGLTPNTTYYVRSYAANSAGTSYGNEVVFTTILNIGKPIVTTVSASAVTQTTAASGGTITSDGGASITARGVCWAPETDMPTTDHRHTADGTGTGTFSSNLTGLTVNTRYFVRAFATNSSGTSYGNPVSFTTSQGLLTVITTAISAITQTTASSGGTITGEGGASVTARGVCWSMTSNPTIASSKTTDGTGAGSFSSSLTGLTGNTTYFVRAYAIGSAGTVYGNEVSFTTIQNTGKPTVTTASISAITLTTATSGGNITGDGGAGITARGVCWSTSSNPTTADTKTTDGTGVGSFTSSLTGLTSNTVYFVRAYAVNSNGTSYGNEVSFTTIQNTGKPTVTTATVSAITQTTAVSGGSVTSDGGAGISARGVCWAPDTDVPTTDHPHTTDGTGSGSFISNLKGLNGNTRYFVRAYATNSAGTSYGAAIVFYTSPGLLTVVTTGISAITQTSASSGGNITGDSGTGITARGVCWSTSANPTTADAKTTDGTGIGSFASNLTGLTGNTTYYVRAYAVSSTGTVYGNLVSFATILNTGKPTVTTASVSAITQTTATSGGNITSDGGASITVRGVCWAPDTDLPTTSHPHTTDGTGTGSFNSDLKGLTADTRYYVRAYATNSAGTSYGNAVNFTTLVGDSGNTNNVLVTDGDSRTAGFNCSNLYPYGPLLTLNKPFNIINVAVGASSTAESVARASYNVDPHLSSGINIVVLWAGIIDIAHSRYLLPAIIPYNNIVTYCKDRKAQGWKVIICTEISVGCGSGDCDKVRLELNDYIRANWSSFADGLADLGANPSIGSYQSYKDTYLFCNELHLYNPGCDIVAEVISKAVNNLLK